MRGSPGRIDLVVLDIAGTTVQEHQAVYEALRCAVADAGQLPSDEAINAWMGADKREAITALLTDAAGGQPSAETVQATFDNFRHLLDAAYRARPPVAIAGVPEALSTLRAEGVKIALTTGFDREVTDNLLAVLGWDDSIVDAVICADDVPAGRPAPYMIFRAMEAVDVRDVRRVLTAGDTIRDLEAGANAGAGIVVGVLTGGQDAAALSSGPLTHLLDSVAAIPSLLTSLATSPTPVSDGHIGRAHSQVWPATTST